VQAITAMAHLRSAVLYIVDLSEHCGFSLEQQAALFHSLKPLFTGKPVLIVANKTDARPFSALNPAQQVLVNGMASEALRLSHGGVVATGGAGTNEQTLLFMSTLQEDGVQAVKNTACDRLLAMREQVKVQSKRAVDLVNRLHVAVPKARDRVKRPPFIPPAVLAERASAAAGAPAASSVKFKTERDMQEEQGGAGVYNADLRKAYLLGNEAWKYDIMPEILDGHNVADFVDPDIDAKLAELEREEDELEVRALCCPPHLHLPDRVHAVTTSCRLLSLCIAKKLPRSVCDHYCDGMT
jgi:nucleolar GTP-binding protein